MIPGRVFLVDDQRLGTERAWIIAPNCASLVRDVDFHGAPLKAGDMIAIPTPLCANYLRHEGEGVAALRSHLTFGSGVHQCPGRHLARMEAEIVLEEWLKRIPEFELQDPDGIRFQGGIVGVVEALPLKWSVV